MMHWDAEKNEYDDVLSDADESVEEDRVEDEMVSDLDANQSEGGVVESIAAGSDDDESSELTYAEELFGVEAAFTEDQDEEAFPAEPEPDSELPLRVFDPLELSPKAREMHASLGLRAQIEAAIFASPKPIKASDLVELVSFTTGLKEIEKNIQDLKEEYATREGGFTLEYVKGMGYQFQSVPVAAPIMEGLFSSRPRPLSRAALETLSIIAYRQPCTRAVVEFIRGVDSGSIIKNLMDREMIKCVGRKEDSGRPMLFGTTDEFLAVFGIRSLEELPPLQSFQPASETLQQALDELDELEREVDIEEFVGDESEVHPEVSEGLLLEGEQVLTDGGSTGDLVVKENTEESVEAAPEAGYEEDRTAKPIMGAVKADDEYDDEPDRQNDEDSKVDSADGEVLTAGGREVDSGGADLN
jgi:segregation and condensation protein B